MRKRSWRRGRLPFTLNTSLNLLLLSRRPLFRPCVDLFSKTYAQFQSYSDDDPSEEIRGINRKTPPSSILCRACFGLLFAISTNLISSGYYIYTRENPCIHNYAKLATTLKYKNENHADVPDRKPPRTRHGSLCTTYAS